MPTKIRTQSLIVKLHLPKSGATPIYLILFSMSIDIPDFSKVLRFAQRRSVELVFYDTFKGLCANKGISCNRAATEIGLSNSTPTKWKKTGAMPDSKTLSMIADYFGVSVGYLLGIETEKAPAETGERAIGDDDIKLALFGGDGEVTDAMWDEALFAIQLIKERHKREKEKNG